jgi:DNA polymerase
MMPKPSASAESPPLIAPNATLIELRKLAAGCTACELYKRGTQTVFGEGSRAARLMLVGEQPGHEEDLAGRPFVGPAGRLLDRALAEAGIDRSAVYVTNVVKHFKWEPRGKRRIHAKPSPREVAACRPWLDAELATLEPEAIVCLGATAAQALLGRRFRVSVDRGRWVTSSLAPHVMATVHPSAILRAPDDAARHAEYERLVADLRIVAEAL